MSIWRFELYAEGEAEPFHSVGVDAKAIPLSALVSGLSVSVQVATDDERVERIVITREPVGEFV
jgi:hypothetical protein